MPTLVKQNTPHCHKIRQECGFTQKVTFFYISLQLCFLPHCCANIGRRLDSCFLTHTKKYITPIHALIIQKYVKMYVYIGHNIKSRSKLITLWGSTCSKKREAGGHFFRTRVRRLRARKPR